MKKYTIENSSHLKIYNIQIKFIFKQSLYSNKIKEKYLVLSC